MGPADSLSVMVHFPGGHLFAITSQSGKEARECLHKLKVGMADQINFFSELMLSSQSVSL